MMTVWARYYPLLFADGTQNLQCAERGHAIDAEQITQATLIQLASYPLRRFKGPMDLVL